MSQENVEIVRAFLAAGQQGQLGEALSHYSEDGVWFNRPPDVGPYHGRDGVVHAIGSFTQHFDEYWFEVEQLLDAGDQVVLHWRQGGTGKSSGAPIREDGSTVFDVDDGRICRAQVYSDRAEALEAAGLSE